MNAEQMFSELGYKKCDECISPVYIKENDPFTWVNFCTTGVGISTQSGLGYEFVNYKLIKAINKRCCFGYAYQKYQHFRKQAYHRGK